MNAIDYLINERKKTSENYIGWQNALALRDRIYKEVGSYGPAQDRVRDLIKGWNERWQAECGRIQALPCETTMQMLAQAEAIFEEASK